MNLKLAIVGFGIIAGACAPVAKSAATADDQVRISVENASSDEVAIRVCGPISCSEKRQVLGRAREVFTFPVSRHTRFIVEAWAGDWLAAQEAVDVVGTGPVLVVLEPARPPGAISFSSNEIRGQSESASPSRRGR